MYLTVTTRSGRRLEIPTPETHSRQELLLRGPLAGLRFPWTVHGYVRGRNIWTCLEPHVGSTYLLHLDLKNFFHSCTEEMVDAGLSALRVPALDRVSVALDCFCNGVLPVGACTSPVLSNAAMLQLDCDLETIHEAGAYTRYSDQLIFSSYRPIQEGLFRKAVREYGFEVNERKSWLRKRGSAKLELFGITIGVSKLQPCKTARRKQRAIENSRNNAQNGGK